MWNVTLPAHATKENSVIYNHTLDVRMQTHILTKFAKNKLVFEQIRETRILHLKT